MDNPWRIHCKTRPMSLPGFDPYLGRAYPDASFSQHVGWAQAGPGGLQQAVHMGSSSRVLEGSLQVWAVCHTAVRPVTALHVEYREALHACSLRVTHQGRLYKTSRAASSHGQA
jgi:hypothetical protein